MANDYLNMIWNTRRDIFSKSVFTVMTDEMWKCCEVHLDTKTAKKIKDGKYQFIAAKTDM